MKQKLQRLKGERMISHLFLKAFMLLAFMLSGIGSAWAQTSLGKMEFNSYPVNGSDGSFYLYSGDNFTAGCHGLDVTTATKSEKLLLKLGGSGYFELNFDQGKIKAGDILKVECGYIYSSTDYDLGFFVGNSTNGVAQKPSDVNEVITLEYTIQSADITTSSDGMQHLQIKRRGDGSHCGFHSIEVVRNGYAYSLNAKNGDNTLKTIASGVTSNMEAFAIAYPRYILSGTTLYGIARNASGDWWRTTVNSENPTKELNYSDTPIKNVVYYTEAEDIAGFVKYDFLNRASNGKIAHTGGADKYKDVTKLKSGSYIIHAHGLNSNSATRNCKFKIGSDVVYTFSFDNGTDKNGTSLEFIVSEDEAMLSVACEGSSSSGLDYFYIERTCSHHIYSSTTIGSTDFTADGWWKNFSPSYELKKGEQLEFSFVNHSDMGKVWNNWVLAVSNVKAHSTEDNSAYKEYLVLRADNYGWAEAYAAPNMFKNGRPSSEWSEAEWSEFQEDMENANVNVKISMSADGKRLYVYAKTVVGDKTYIMTENTKEFAEASSVNVFFTAENAYLTDFQLVSTKKAYKVYTYNFTGGTAEVTNDDGLIVPAEGVYMGVGEHIKAVPKPLPGYAFKEWGNETTAVPRIYTVENADIGVWCTMVEAGFKVAELEVNLLDLKKNDAPTFTDATYRSSNEKIAVVDPTTGALTFLKAGYCSIIGSINGQDFSYQLKVKADDAEYNVVSNVVDGNTKYTYTVTKAGKLQSNYVSEIPGIEIQFGSDGETPIVRNVRSGFGVAVIGAADGYKGSLIPNKDPMANSGVPTTGTYYIVKPTINGKLSFNGYTSGGHHASLIELVDGVYKEKDNAGFGGNVNELVQSKEYAVEAGKTYYIVERLNSSTGSDGYFALKSLSFTPTMKFETKGEILAKQTSYELDPKPILGIGSGQTYSYKVSVIKDAGSNLSVEQEDVASNGKIKISSLEDSDGGSVLVKAVVDGEETGLAYVLTIPYIGNHSWNFHNLEDKNENQTNAHWYLTYEVRMPNTKGVKNPIVVIQDKMDKDNAALINETNGLTFSTDGNSGLGLAVVRDEIDNTNDDTRMAATIADVREVSLVAVKGATMTIPYVKKDWFVKIYLDPHTGNASGHGSGSEFTVTNLNDLNGKYIEPTHVIRSFGTQWTTSTTYDDKTSGSPYAGCLIFRAHSDGPVTFNFTNDGWDKIVRVDVSDTYSTEMVLASHASRVVDYLRWNHNWVHRVHVDAEGKEYGDGVSFYYNGDASAHAENAKLIDHKIICVDGNMATTLSDDNWNSKRGAAYRQANLKAGLNGSTTDKRNGVGNIKILSNATYSAYEQGGTGEKLKVGGKEVNYVLNSTETWLVVGKLKVQNYPYTWDFSNYHMDFDNTMPENNRSVYKMAEGRRIHSVSGAEVASDTTYGYWNNGKTNHLNYTVVGSSNQGKTNYSDQTSPFYTIHADGSKDYNRPIYKPLFANGAQLTYGFDPIPETEGLGISINQAYVTYKKVDSYNIPDYDNIHEEQISLDGNKLQVNGANYTITIPEVPAGMYVFVSSSAAPTSYTNLKTSDTTFEPHAGVTYYQVDKDGDVLLNFNSGASVYRIGVTDQVKEILYYGWTTESRAVDIDYNETRYFSANVEGSYITNVEGWKQHSDKFDFDKDLEVRIGNVGVTKTIADHASVEQGQGIILRNKDVVYNCEDRDTNKDKKYIVPLFVPACNIEHMSYGDTPNRLTGSTYKDVMGVHNRTIKTSTENTNENYYTLSIFYVGVKDRDDNTWTSDKVFTNIPRFYRYVGDNGTAAGTEIEVKNKAYLILKRDADAKLLGSDMIRLDCDNFLEPAATKIESITTSGINAAEDGVFYNVNGQPINGTPAVPGIYIKNGVKYYVK